MDQQALWSIESILQLLVIGAVVGAPILAVSIRIALKPLLETYLNAQKLPDGEQVRQQMQLMEAEIRGLQQTLQAVLDADDFRRQLSAEVPARVERPNAPEALAQPDVSRAP